MVSTRTLTSSYFSCSKILIFFNTPVLPRSKNGDVYASHGGADVIMRDMLFRGFEEDKLHQMADIRAGAMSLAVGFAANIAIGVLSELRF